MAANVIGPIGRAWDWFLVAFAKFIMWGFIGLELLLGVLLITMGVHRGRDGSFGLGALFIIAFPWLLTKVQRIRF
jgi:hypothetical protein